MNKRKTKTISAALLAAAVLALAGCAQNEKAPESAPAAEPTIEATAKPAAEAVTEPAAEPTAQAVTEPAADPTAEAVTEPAAEPTAEAVAEPAAEPTAEAATEPVTEPAAETTPAATTTAEPADVPEESDEANQKAQEQQAAPEDVIAAPEQEVQAAEDKPTYTTDGIPLTTDGDLTAPVKPTKNYKLPKNAQLEFTGDASTALTTELPDGCVWTPTPVYTNAYTDAAGNLWINNKRPSDPAEDGNRNGGYYDPSGSYHTTQDEIDFAEAMWKRDQEITDAIMSGSLVISEGSLDGATQEEIDELNRLFGLTS